RRRHPQPFIFGRGQATRPWVIAGARGAARTWPGRADPSSLGRRQRLESPQSVRDGGGVRPIPRLVDGCLPAARQPLANPLAEGAGQVLVEERTEEDLLGIPDHCVSCRWIPTTPPRQRGLDPILERPQRVLSIGRQEPRDRG